MFEQAFRNIDDVLWKDAGCTSEIIPALISLIPERCTSGVSTQLSQPPSPSAVLTKISFCSYGAPISCELIGIIEPASPSNQLAIA